MNCHYITLLCLSEVSHFREMTHFLIDICSIHVLDVNTCVYDCLVGQAVKASALRAAGMGFNSRLRQDFSALTHTSDLNIGTPVATLQGT